MQVQIWSYDVLNKQFDVFQREGAAEREEEEEAGAVPGPEGLTPLSS